ncbi:MAG: TatD family hydrolase [Bacteroidetes bacterium]|nr:TatD family hydrolase [Bacteroidota bacterium]
MIVDTHAHLYYESLINNIEDVLKRAEDAGVEKIIAPAVDYNTSLQLLELSAKYNMIYAALGIHPCDVNKYEYNELEKIEKLFGNEKIVGVGETGIDYYWDTSYNDKQKEFFRLHIELAKDKELPVIIHTRNSIDDAIQVVIENYSEKLKGQFHCFDGTVEQLNKVMRIENSFQSPEKSSGLGTFYVSFTGNVTYKKYSYTDTVAKIPIDKILSETDSPFLSPVPYRGKPNEPAYIVNTIKKIAEIKNMNEEDMKKQLRENAKSLFNI